MTKLKLPKVKFTYKIAYHSYIKSNSKVVIRTVQDAHNCFLSCADLDLLERKEQVIAFYLDWANNLIGASHISVGGVAGCVIDPKILFSEALLIGASLIMIGHNHPSGRLVASAQDKKITKQLYNAGQLLEVHLLDHLIFTRNDCISLRDNCPELFGK